MSEPRENVTLENPIPRPAETGDTRRVAINKTDNRENSRAFIFFITPQ
jgi:hypothetical protein